MSITIKINDNQVKVEEGMTILEAAQLNDIYIPRLCYHPSLGSSHGQKSVDTIYRGFDNLL
jgi:NADH dehydrogenase/NADH:ubiquinone oxidoreductase subunit G